VKWIAQNTLSRVALQTLFDISRINKHTRSLLFILSFIHLFPEANQITRRLSLRQMENGNATARDPSGFLSQSIGARVTVKLNSGVVYKGEGLRRFYRLLAAAIC
jgi:hypothetical protein